MRANIRNNVKTTTTTTTAKIPGAQFDRPMIDSNGEQRMHGVSHDSIDSCRLKFSTVRVVISRKSFEKYSNRLDLAVFETITRLSISLMFFFRFKIAKTGKKNVVCALKNIKHHMNFTPYKLIDTTNSAELMKKKKRRNKEDETT